MRRGRRVSHWEGGWPSTCLRVKEDQMLKLADVTFDESLTRKMKPATLVGKLLGEVTEEDLVSVIWHGGQPPSKGGAGIVVKGVESLSQRITPVIVGEDD